TDASAYREIPIAVTRPLNVEDIRKLVKFAGENKIPLIPRTAGTSLAGQVVGGGIVVDVSRHLTEIVYLDIENKRVTVQPGVILDELNAFLAPHGLFFGPETSTSNRCMIGGMVGNNSCGAHSLIYGSTRDHTISVKCILSDGSDAEFQALSEEEYRKKLALTTLEGRIYKHLDKILSNTDNQAEIRAQYPDPAVKRRNTGYAIDILLETDPFSANGRPLNIASLIAGSEGTLAFITEITLNLVPLPPKHKALVCIHCHTLEEAFRGNLLALKHHPVAIELMDKTIMDLTKENITQNKNRFFISGDPAAMLIVEFVASSEAEIDEATKALEADMLANGFGYHYPVVKGKDIGKVWALRKAGLGVLSNMPGDRKPVPVIEDTAVKPEFLPDYMRDFQEVLARYELQCVYYAHIATGEIHLRPILNLKDPADTELFRTIAREIATLVKKYKGSLSGEHGDGRLRGEFIPFMIGDHNYDLLKEIKATWDPDRILNPGKITDTPRMNTSLRFEPGRKYQKLKTVYDFSSDGGFLCAVERCNGSGDCRKTIKGGGTMCPSYMATLDEENTTRARANILREYITNGGKKNPFDSDEIYKVLDLCLMCKACKSECPSNVDMAILKAEFLQHYHDANGVPLRSTIIANITKLNRIGSIFPSAFNFFASNKTTAGVLKWLLGFAPKRSIPLIGKYRLTTWAKRNLEKLNPPADKAKKKVLFFVDEFTEYNDTGIGIKAIKLLTSLGYHVSIPKHTVSGRTYISKGLLRKAAKIASKNVRLLGSLVSEDVVLVGIEPSGILGFRDEYPGLVSSELRPLAEGLAQRSLMIDEFIAKEYANGNISSDSFKTEPMVVHLHGHCQQKAIASIEPTRQMLCIPDGVSVKVIPSGCCGMAGSFGYEAEHFDLSNAVGELVLFPAVRKADESDIVAAPGTSCRHHIKDGTGRKAVHPIEILFGALNK
ncbi:MAG: FAD-binding protein, partial [Bacteroidetes bacterium]|nr:FAD-binding protein [Bacteroidota bacterium]